MRLTDGRRRLVATLVLFIGAAWAPGASADDHDHVRGVIAGRAAGGALVLYADDGTNVTVIVSDATKVRREVNLRQRKASSDLLMPGLRIDASGKFTSPDRFVAERVRFGGSDLKIARAIRGGIGPTEQRSLEIQRRVADNAQLIDRQRKTLQQQEVTIVVEK